MNNEKAYRTEEDIKNTNQKECKMIEMMRDAALDREMDYKPKNYADQFLEEEWLNALSKAARIANARAVLREKFINKDVIKLTSLTENDEDVSR